MIERHYLKQRQSLPLEQKIRLSEMRIRAWHEHWQGMTYVAFSGGKDSTVLLDVVRSMYPNTPAVFSDTGLEYPEIRDFVKTIDNVVWVKPDMKFPQVVAELGYPVATKKVARQVRILRNPTENNVASRNLYLTGIKRDGTTAMSYKLPKKWLPLIDAPFDSSEQCCDKIKKQPMYTYGKETGRVPYLGTMAVESQFRTGLYLRQGCNAFDAQKPVSAPMAFWLEEDIWEYIRTRNLPYSKIYDMGEKRTGCMFCMFGVHMEKGENRFQRMKRSHPKQWAYCMDKLGLREVLNFINVETGD